MTQPEDPTPESGGGLPISPLGKRTKGAEATEAAAVGHPDPEIIAMVAAAKELSTIVRGLVDRLDDQLDAILEAVQGE